MTSVNLPLQTERMPKGRRFLLRGIEVYVEGFGVVSVPEGYVTDYSSIPFWARWVVRWSRVDIAGVVHDYLYETRCVPRSKADMIWRIVARAGAHRANWIQAWVCWLGLRLGGWIYYYRRPTGE